MNKPRILVIEDDSAIINLIRTTLEMQDYQYHTAQTGAVGLMEATSYNADVIILDLGLPDMDGVEIIQKIRGWSAVPIIVVSARSEDNDKVEALDTGADDYLTKPFSVDELLARLRAALRRRQLDDASLAPQKSVYQNGRLSIDYSAGCAYMDNKEIHLTPIEYRLLCVLAKNTGRVLTHNYILKEVWGNSFSDDASSLRVFMATLRKKIEQNPAEPKYIQTHIGVGYRMIRQ